MHAKSDKTAGHAVVAETKRTRQGASLPDEMAGLPCPPRSVTPIGRAGFKPALVCPDTGFRRYDENKPPGVFGHTSLKPAVSSREPFAQRKAWRSRPGWARQAVTKENQTPAWAHGLLDSGLLRNDACGRRFCAEVAGPYLLRNKATEGNVHLARNPPSTGRG